MAEVGFIGLGNMGGPMVRNLIKAGHSLKVYDLSEDAINFAVQAGAVATKSVKEASSEVDFVVTMVPVGSNVREIFLEDGILAAAAPGTVMIDSSTIDVGSAQAVHEAAKSAGLLVFGLTAGKHWHSNRDKNELYDNGALNVFANYNEIEIALNGL